MSLAATCVPPMLFYHNGVSSRLRSAAIWRITLKICTRIGTWRVIGTPDVSFFFFFFGSVFIILMRRHPSLVPPGEQSLYSSPFFRDFWHLNVAMMTSNNALIPDPDKEDVLASKPTDWPWMRLGLRMCGWGDNQIKYYLLGTPVIWWSGSLSLVLSLIAFGSYLLRMQRRYNDFEPGMLSCSSSGSF